MKVGQIVELNNKKEYLVYKEKNNIFCLMSLTKPVEFLFLNSSLEQITNKNIIISLLKEQ